MADAFPTLAKTTTATTGTAAAYVLDTAVLTTAHQTPKQAVAKGSLADGDIVCYEVRDETVTGDASFERGVGVYTDATNEISRLAANVKDGSNGPGVLVSWPGSGTRTVVLLDVNPEDVAKINRANTFTESQTVSSTTIFVETVIESSAVNGQAQIRLLNDAQNFGISVIGADGDSLRIRDVTNGKNVFYVDPGCKADGFRLGANGLGVGVSAQTDLHVQESTTDTTPTVEIEQLSTGDAGLQLSIAGRAYALGIDNSDSDKFKISTAAGAGTAVLGTGDLLVITSTGDVALGGLATPDSLLHIHKATAGAVTAQASSVLVLENNASMALSFIGTTTSDNIIYFGDTDDSGRASILYSHVTDKLSFVTSGGSGLMNFTSAGLRIGSSAAGTELLTIDCATEKLEVVDAGSTGATEQDWIEVQVGDVTGYIRVFATK